MKKKVILIGADFGMNTGTFLDNPKTKVLIVLAGGAGKSCSAKDISKFEGSCNNDIKNEEKKILVQNYNTSFIDNVNTTVRKERKNNRKKKNRKKKGKKTH
jgi:hypothetical protein